MRDLDEHEEADYYYARRPPSRAGGNKVVNGRGPSPPAPNNVEDNGYTPTSTVFKLGNGIAVRPSSRGGKQRSASPPQPTTQLKARIGSVNFNGPSYDELRSDFREQHERQHERIEALLSAHKKAIIEEVVSVVAKLEEVASTPPQLPLPLVPLTPEMREHPWYSLDGCFGGGGVKRPVGEPAMLPGMMNGGGGNGAAPNGVRDSAPNGMSNGSPPKGKKLAVTDRPGQRKNSRSPRGDFPKPEPWDRDRRRSPRPRERREEPDPPKPIIKESSVGATEPVSGGQKGKIRKSEKSVLFLNSPAEKKLLRKKSVHQGDGPQGTVIRISNKLNDIDANTFLADMAPTFSWPLDGDSGTRRCMCSCSPRLWAKAITSNRIFEIFVCLLITMNAITIGAQADWDLQHEETAGVFRHLDLFFTSVFSVELVLRLLAQGRSFCSRDNPELYWNIFDSTLVAAVLMEEVALQLQRQWINVTVARVLRMQRLVRASRVVRAMRFFRDLRTMVTAIAVSLKMLIWALLLLFLVMFLFAVVVMQIVAEHGIDPEDTVALDFYGSFLNTFYTLWMSILGGIDWQDAAAPLWEVGPLLGMAYCFYIAFAQLCVLNIVTGIFVDNATKITERDDEKVFLDELQNRKKWCTDVENLFRGADKTATGLIEFDTFEDYVRDQRTVILFKQLGIDLEGHDTRAFFDLLDFDNDGKLSMSEFVLGLQRINGKARSVDLAHVMHDCKALKRAITELSDLVSNAFSHFGYAEFSCTASQFIRDSNSPSITPKHSNSQRSAGLRGTASRANMGNMPHTLVAFDEDTPRTNRSDDW